MLKLITADGKSEFEYLSDLSKRAELTNKEAGKIVEDIIEQVKSNGDSALFELTEKFDNVKLPALELGREELEQRAKLCPPDLQATMEKAAHNIREFHSQQARKGFSIQRSLGESVGQRIIPLQRVGIYVPGGTASYPSSVLMNAIPAKVAGVEEIIMVTPPSKCGGIDPAIAAAALIAGIDRIFMIGGAQAVAALAFGTETIPKVDKIVGPGNIFVATAKKCLFGVVDIDMIAGPSEVLIIADETADPAYAAADLLSQAEHDKLAGSTLLCLSASFAQKVINEVERQTQKLSRKSIIESALKNAGAVIVCRSINEAVALANEIAPEHLELMCSDAMILLEEIRNAGSVFIGSYSPEPLGDYFAGPNHVLPTSGTSRFFSPLGVDSFVKRSSYIYYDRKALKKAAEDIMRFADTEGLTAHANSIAVRFKDEEI